MLKFDLPPSAELGIIVSDTFRVNINMYSACQSQLVEEPLATEGKRRKT
jgi:hypothetical protein